MNSIMWIQSSGKGTDDYYFVDGMLVQGPEENVFAERHLGQIERYAPLFMRRKENARKRLGSPNFTLSYIPGKGFIYKSIFNEPAEDGRIASFAVWFNNSASKDIWATLSINAEVVNRTLREDERPVVENFVKKKRVVSLTCCSLLIIVVFLIISLCKK